MLRRKPTGIELKEEDVQELEQAIAEKEKNKSTNKTNSQQKVSDKRKEVARRIGHE